MNEWANGIRGKGYAIAAIILGAVFALGCVVGNGVSNGVEAVAADKPDASASKAYAKLMDHCDSCHNAEGVKIGGSDTDQEEGETRRDELPGDKAPATEFGSQVEQTCTLCHTLERVEAAEYDKAGWVSLVERMTAKGAPLTEPEKYAEYLYQAYGPNGSHKKVGTKPVPDAEGKALVEKICGQCHGLVNKKTGMDFDGRGERPGYEMMEGTKMQLTKRSAWGPTVSRMKDVNKCPMSSGEEGKIVQWLDENVK